MGQLFIGTAGWGIPARHAPDFPVGGTHLERYAQRLNCAEINSSFYREHRPETYERWAASVPPHFRFSVKVLKTISHEKGLADCDEQLDRFFSQAHGLGEKLGAVLVQTPPQLAFTPGKLGKFLDLLAQRSKAAIAFEPRHRSWFDGSADDLFAERGVARVAADPARFPTASRPGGSTALAYFRLHGSPTIYRSSYASDALERIRSDMAQAQRNEVWCIFDNTAEGHALGNALSIAEAEPVPHNGVGTDAIRS